MPLTSRSKKSKTNRDCLEFENSQAIQDHQQRPQLFGSTLVSGYGTGILSLEAGFFLGAGGNLYLLRIFDVFVENRFVGTSFILDERIA